MWEAYFSGRLDAEVAHLLEMSVTPVARLIAAMLYAFARTNLAFKEPFAVFLPDNAWRALKSALGTDKDHFSNDLYPNPNFVLYDEANHPLRLVFINRDSIIPTEPPSPVAPRTERVD